MVCSSNRHVPLVGAAPAIKHEWSASPACSVVDLCSSSCDLDDVEQPPLLLENSPRHDVATAQPAADATTQETSAAQQLFAPASVADHLPTLTGLQSHQALRQASQAAIDAHRSCRISNQDRANVPAAGGPVRAPVHGPRLPDRPQKRKCTSTGAEADAGPTQGSCALQTLPGNDRNEGTAGLGETHLQTPPSNTANPGPEQQRLPAPEGKGQTKQTQLAASRPTNIASIKKVKLEHTPPQAPTADPCDAPGPLGWQTPAAAPLLHQGSLPPQTNAAANTRQMLGAVQQAHVQQVQTSLPMTTDSHEQQRQQLQQVLSLFGGDTAVGLAAKEAALTQLVMLVAGNMYTPFLQPVVASHIAHVA